MLQVGHLIYIDSSIQLPVAKARRVRVFPRVWRHNIVVDKLNHGCKPETVTKSSRTEVCIRYSGAFWLAFIHSFEQLICVIREDVEGRGNDCNVAWCFGHQHQVIQANWVTTVGLEQNDQLAILIGGQLMPSDHRIHPFIPSFTNTRLKRDWFDWKDDLNSSTRIHRHHCSLESR